MLTCSMMSFLSLFLLGMYVSLCLCLLSCGRLWFVCEVVVPFMDAVVSVTVMRVLFVLHVCMLRQCECDANASVGDGCGCGECRACG